MKRFRFTARNHDTGRVFMGFVNGEKWYSDGHWLAHNVRVVPPKYTTGLREIQSMQDFVDRTLQRVSNVVVRCDNTWECRTVADTSGPIDPQARCVPNTNIWIQESHYQRLLDLDISAQATEKTPLPARDPKTGNLLALVMPLSFERAFGVKMKRPA